MEIVSLGMEVLQSIAEHAASYRLGQSTLRLFDRALWVVEKCARWAVPPPLEQDERPQPELVRPLPWVFFLMMLLVLRVTRESISLANLIMGKPPLRSADVVMFIQSKRRYLRTLKYQGNRMMRARSSQAQQPWYSGMLSLFELTMCFRRQPVNYGNNNTTRVTNNDEVMVIKRNKRGRQEEASIVPSTESTMERLIEKMMTDLDADSDEDSNHTLTNITSAQSNISELTESDQDTICPTSPPTQAHTTEISQTNGDDIHFSPNKNENASSTPEKENHNENNIDNDKTATDNSVSTEEKRQFNENINEASSNSVRENSKFEDAINCQNAAVIPPEEKTFSPKRETEHFISNESAQNPQRTPKKDHKIANGRTVKGVPSKKKVNVRERRESNEALQQRVPPSNHTQ